MARLILPDNFVVYFTESGEMRTFVLRPGFMFLMTEYRENGRKARSSMGYGLAKVLVQRWLDDPRVTVVL